MRVSKLYVICMRKPNIDRLTYLDAQFVEEARAIALRSVMLEKAKRAHVVEYAPYTFDEEESARGPKRISSETIYGEGQSEDRIGVYIIAHGSHEGMSGMSFADIAWVLSDLGIKRLDKLGFVSCGIGLDFPGEKLPNSWEMEGASSDFKSYLSRACCYLGQSGYGNGEDGAIMVSGWTTYVTIAFPGRQSQSDLGKKTTKNESWGDLERKDKLKKMNSGRKYAQDGNLKKFPVHMIRKKDKEGGTGGAKVFFSWSRGRGLRSIQEAEWTDRV